MQELSCRGVTSPGRIKFPEAQIYFSLGHPSQYTNSQTTSLCIAVKTRVVYTSHRNESFLEELIVNQTNVRFFSYKEKEQILK